MNRNHVAALRNVVSGILSAFVVVVMTISTVSANEIKRNPELGAVKYLGSENDQLSFFMSYENDVNEKYVITIADADGIVLFEGVFSDRKFVKTFKVPADAGTITFSVSSYRNKSDKKFVAVAERKVYEDVVVTKPVAKP